MKVVDEIKAEETAEKLKGNSPQRGKILLGILYQAISNGKDCSSAFQELKLTEQDGLYPIFNNEVRPMMEAAEDKESRVLLLDKMMAVF